MRQAKLISILILIALALITVLIASSSGEDSLEAGTEGASPSAEEGLSTVEPTKMPALTAGVFLRDESSSLYESGARAYAESMENLELKVYYAGDSEEQQLEDVRQFIETYGEKGVFLVEPVSQANLQAIAELAEEGGTYWSSVGETAKRLYPMEYNYYSVYQGVDQQEAGYNAPETLVAYMDESQSNYIFVIDMAGASGDIAERQYGLNRALGRRLDIIVERREAAYDRKSARELVTGWLEEYEGPLEGIWCADDQLALGALDALEELGRDDVKVMGIQPSEESFAEIRQGHMESIYTYERIQGAYGLAVPCLAAAGAVDVASLSSAQRYFYVPQVAVDSENAEAVMERINSVDLLYPGNWMGEAIDIPIS